VWGIVSASGSGGSGGASGGAKENIRETPHSGKMSVPSELSKRRATREASWRKEAVCQHMVRQERAVAKK